MGGGGGRNGSNGGKKILGKVGPVMIAYTRSYPLLLSLDLRQLQSHPHPRYNVLLCGEAAPVVGEGVWIALSGAWC